MICKVYVGGDKCFSFCDNVCCCYCIEGCNWGSIDNLGIFCWEFICSIVIFNFLGFFLVLEILFLMIFFLVFEILFFFMILNFVDLVINFIDFELFFLNFYLYFVIFVVLGVGLGVGLLFIVVIVIFVLWFYCGWKCNCLLDEKYIFLVVVFFYNGNVGMYK